MLARETDSRVSNKHLRNATLSFSGRKEYVDTIATPALSPIRRVGTNSNKVGTLWDPRFNAGDVTVDPKIARYYKKLTGGF